jgi:hypothetical protein
MLMRMTGQNNFGKKSRGSTAAATSRPSAAFLSVLLEFRRLIVALDQDRFSLGKIHFVTLEPTSNIIKLNKIFG